VVQVIVAPEEVMPPAATLEMTNGAVVKVKSPETARLPAASLDLTR